MPTIGATTMITAQVMRADGSRPRLRNTRSTSAACISSTATSASVDHDQSDGNRPSSACGGREGRQGCQAFDHAR